MSADSLKKTVGVALGVCLVCSVLVSTAAVVLKPIQEQNKKRDMLKNILEVAEIEYTDSEIDKKFKENISAELLDMKTGEKVPASEHDKVFNTEDFNIKQILLKKENRFDIPSKADVAKIRYTPRKMIVWFVKGDNGISKIIFPVYGKGLWSTMYGLISLDYSDLTTIKGLTFYEHGETPGLGGEVDNPQWKKQWPGKQAFSKERELAVKVIKGKVRADSSNAIHEIDGLSGATITANGVNGLLTFWLNSDYGYKKFLKKLEQEGRVKNEQI